MISFADITSLLLSFICSSFSLTLPITSSTYLNGLTPYSITSSYAR